jgi:hypothetical protein
MKNSIYYKTLKSLVPLFIYGIRRRESDQQLTESGYALQLVVVLFGELLSQLEEASLSHTYQDVFHFCELENIT